MRKKENFRYLAALRMGIQLAGHYKFDLNLKIMELAGTEVLCAKCEDNPDDVLILTCEHNLCLTCAAKNLHEQE